MKKLSIIGLILLFPALTWSAPFLVCDPQSNVEEYIVVFDGIEEIVPYNDAGGDVVLKDLAGIAVGTHNITVRGKNLWGQSVDVPFDFIKALPGAPSGIGLRE